mgnify:CR=1 FL=1
MGLFLHVLITIQFVFLKIVKLKKVKKSFETTERLRNRMRKENCRKRLYTLRPVSHAEIVSSLCNLCLCIL